MLVEAHPQEPSLHNVKYNTRGKEQSRPNRIPIQSTPLCSSVLKDVGTPKSVHVKIYYPSSRAPLYNSSNLLDCIANSRRKAKKRSNSEVHSVLFPLPAEESQNLQYGVNSPEAFSNPVEVHVTRNPLLGLPAFEVANRQRSFPREVSENAKKRDDSYSSSTEAYRSVSFCSHGNYQSSISRFLVSSTLSRRRRLVRNVYGPFSAQEVVELNSMVVPEQCPDDVVEREIDRTWMPGKELRISYVTWNMANREPNAMQVSSQCIHPNGHIVVIATQENGPYIGSNRAQKEFEKLVSSVCLKNEYDVVGIKKMWALHLMVLARRRDVAQYVSHVETAKVSSGILGVGGNKGAVGVSLTIHLSSISCGPSIPVWTVEKQSQSSVPEESRVSNETVKMNNTNDNDNNNDNNSNSDSGTISPLKSPLLKMLFINAHFPAHLDAMERRNSCYHKILKSIKVGSKGSAPHLYTKPSCTAAATTTTTSIIPPPARSLSYSNARPNPLNSSTAKSIVSSSRPRSISLTSTVSVARMDSKREMMNRGVRNASDEFDITFFGGDLNYRIEGKKSEVEEIVTTKGFFRKLLANDQLLTEKAKGNVFEGFEEGKLTFRPTYKYEIPNENAVPSSRKRDSQYPPNPFGYHEAIHGKKARTPAYCDRVLFRIPHHSKVSKAAVALYTDVPNVVTSDHRPVVSLFDLSLQGY